MAKRKRKKMPEGIFSAQIHAFSHEGRGIANIDGKITFISNALPGEEVNFVYTSQNNRYAKGKACEIIKASPERTPAKCKHFGVCGGCSLQHLTHQAQLQLKQTALEEQLQHFASLIPKQWLNPLTGPIYAYRHKARLGVRYVYKKQSVFVGFREQQSRYLADIEQCEILHPSVGQLIIPLREMITTLSIYEHIAQIEVAVGDQQTALLVRHLKPIIERDKNTLKTFSKKHNLMLFLQPNKPESLQKLWPENDDHLLFYRHPDFDITLWFHPLDFTQINPEVNRKMVKLAIELLELDAQDHILDLFCGLGNFTLPLSRKVSHVTGVEGNKEMVRRAKMNAERNSIDNAEFFIANLDEPLTQEWAKRSYDKLLLDPARSGALNVLDNLQQWAVERIVYISCNPATLARDAAKICGQGYQLEKAGIIDMFPQTNHVESVAVFIKDLS